MRLLLAVALVVALSGCTGSARRESAVEATSTTLAHDARNLLLGTVFTADQIPLAGVTVRVEGRPEARITGDQGSFRFEDLTPGEHVLHATKEGFAEGVQRATVQDGLATVVNVTLGEAPKAVFHETQTFRGQVSCYVTAANDPETGTHQDCNTVDPTAKPSNDFPVNPGAARLLLEVFWTPSTALARNLTIKVETAEGGTVFAHYSGAPGLRAQIGDLNLARYFGGGGKVRVTMESGPSVRPPANAPIGFGAAVEQAFEIDCTVFYGDAGDPGFTFKPA